MKKYVKIIATAVALLMVVLLAAACSPLTALMPSNTPEQAAAPMESPSATPDPAPTPSPSPTESAAPAYAEGTLTDQMYTSEYLGLQWAIPEGSDLALATKDEMSAFAGAEADSGAGTFEMMAADAASTMNVMVATETIPLSNMPLEQYAAAYAKSIAARKGYSSAGEPETVSIAGMDFIKEPLTIDYGEGVLVSQDYYFTKKDNRSLCIIMTYGEESVEVAAAALAAFQPYAK